MDNPSHEESNGWLSSDDFIDERGTVINNDYQKRRLSCLSICDSFVLETSLIIYSLLLLLLCLSLVGLISIVTVLLLIDDSFGEEMSHENWVTINASIASRHPQYLGANRHYTDSRTESGRKPKKAKKSPRWIRDLERVKLKLKNMVEKYDQKSKHLNKLYTGVVQCRLSNCGSNVSPEMMKPEEFNCNEYKKLRDLKKWTSVILLKGYNDCRTYEDQFQELIRFEISSAFPRKDEHCGSRLTILKELQSEIRALNVEILDVKIVKAKQRLNTSEVPSKMESGLIRVQTDLKIREWLIIQESKQYLIRFCENLQLVCNCWEGRKWRSKVSKKRSGRPKKLIVNSTDFVD